MAQEADRPKGFQMLQFLYKLFTKQNILEAWAHHGSGGRSAQGLSDASIPLQIDNKTKHFGLWGLMAVIRGDLQAGTFIMI